MKYRTKSVEVEAVQWDGFNQSEIIKFMTTHTSSISFPMGHTCTITVHHREGDMQAHPGDWIVNRGGELIVCGKLAFADLYEAEAGR